MEYTVNSLLNEALRYKDAEKDLDNALKYAMLAASASYSPRADVCCCIGEIYLLKNNYVWARVWFKQAVNNMSMDIDEVMPEADFLTIIPLQKLCYLEYQCGNVTEAREYNDAVLLMDPKNEVALTNKELFT